MWSTQYNSPKTQTPNEYNTTIDSTNSTYTVFSSTRKLNPGTTHAYVIPLDQTFPMCWAYYPSVSTGTYHEKNAGSFKMELPSTGGCGVGQGPVAKPVATTHGVIMFVTWTIIALA